MFVSSCFNSRSRVGSDPLCGIWARTNVVSIRAPAWGATSITQAQFRALVVSIRAPAWGATWLHFQVAVSLTVSIRAPAWGATRNDKYFILVYNVSIRAPAWGATSGKPINSFNHEWVSIRAPAWGATVGADWKPIMGRFQFALPRGERHKAFFVQILPRLFQFALPRGERQNKPLKRFLEARFNSRSRVGSD